MQGGRSTQDRDPSIHLDGHLRLQFPASSIYAIDPMSTSERCSAASCCALGTSKLSPALLLLRLPGASVDFRGRPRVHTWLQ